MVQGLPQASELVNEKYSNFVKERLAEGEKLIFKPISRSSIKTSKEKKKPRKKKITVLKEDKQEFGENKPTGLDQVFRYPIISVSLSIASPDSSLYLCDKACFRNYIMKPSKSLSSSFAQIAKWIIDGMQQCIL